MRIHTTIAALFLLVSGTAFAQSSAKTSAPVATVQVADLMTKPLADYPGKEGKMLLVTYPPGWADPVHRHNAHAFVYVLEGHVEMALNGDKPVTLGPGQTFHEGPHDVHTVGRNASRTEPAKFVVVLLKDANAPVLVHVH